MEKVIGYKDPADFKVRELTLVREDRGLNAIPVGPELTFSHERKSRNRS